MKLPAKGFVLVLMGATVSLSLGARNEPLWSAARDGKLEDVREALAAGAKVDAKGEGGATALFYAAQYGHAEVVEFLAGRGADVNVAAVIDIGDRSYRVTALGAAALGGYADVVRALLKHGADPPEYMVIP